MDDSSNSEMGEMLITLTSDIVAAHVSNNSVAVEDVSTLISNVYSALSGLGADGSATEEVPDPAVSIRSSAKKDHLVCLDCGKKMKMLKRHLSTEHDLTPEDYRARWNLSADYPMVAPDYAATSRSRSVSDASRDRSAVARGKATADDQACLRTSLERWAAISRGLVQHQCGRSAALFAVRDSAQEAAAKSWLNHWRRGICWEISK